MKNSAHIYFSQVNAVWQIMLTVYKRFFHYTVFRFVLWLYAVVTGSVIALPVIIGSVVFIGYSNLTVLAQTIINTAVPMEMWTMTDWLKIFQDYGLSLAILAILFIVIVCIYIFTFTYVGFLVQVGFKSYVQKQNLTQSVRPFLFSVSYFKRVFDILVWAGIYYLIPLCILLIAALLFLVSGGLNAIGYDGGITFTV